MMKPQIPLCLLLSNIPKATPQGTTQRATRCNTYIGVGLPSFGRETPLMALGGGDRYSFSKTSGGMVTPFSELLSLKRFLVVPLVISSWVAVFISSFMSN